MRDEPMDEDDSFHRPVPCSTPMNRAFMSQAPRVEKEEDPDSDDSFETFAPTVSTQSTGGSVRSGESAGSAVCSTESKSSLPQLCTNQPRVINQRTTIKPAVPTSFVAFSQQATQRIGTANVSKCAPPRTGVPFQPKMQNSVMTQNDKGVLAAKTVKEREIAQKVSSAWTTTPSSPTSLSRHSSANSGLRNINFNTPAIKTGNMFAVKKTPPTQEMRPATPSGEIKMLRDQLKNEKHKSQKLQADFQKDIQKNLLNHKKELAERDELIRKQAKDIEVLKTENACRKTELPVIGKNTIISPTVQMTEVKKVYPRIPTDSGNLRRTPRRTATLLQPVSAFRHETRSEDDDTFQLDTSFEPSATSTPKVPIFPRTGIRRPLVLDAELADCANGAPTPKRKPVFEPERRRRNREELDEEIRKIWAEIDEEGSLSQLFFKKNEEEKRQSEDEMETDEEKDDWIDEYLSKQVKNINFRKTLGKSMGTAKAKSKMLQQAERKPMVSCSCSCCGIDDKTTTGSGETSGKEWEMMEKQRTDREKRGAEELRALQYSNLLQGISRKGIDVMEGTSQRKDQIEREYQQKIMRVRKRSLEEIRAEKKELWKTTMMNELRENGELAAVLEIPESGRNEDCIWTSDSDDEDWMFPEPYDQKKWELCSDCARRQRLMRRISKREREKRRIKTECLKEYGVEHREMLRNMSILTKSKMEAADNELNRHVEEMFADEDIF